MSKPFLQWAGGKYRILEELKKYFPTGKRFIEPFIGAGSVSFNVSYPSFIINDVNQDLISVYSFLSSHGTDFIADTKKLFIPENGTKEAYQALKLEFNSSTDKYRKACLFVYLNRHCFNGLCRYNSKGQFNTPVGTLGKASFPEKEMNEAIAVLSKFVIKCGDFRLIFDEVTEGDVVYCDPPYLPLSPSASFSAYAKGGFNLKDHEDLANCAIKASQKGVTVIISNHWTPDSERLYANAEINLLNVNRVISCKGDNRKPVKEVIAVFKPCKMQGL